MVEPKTGHEWEIPACVLIMADDTRTAYLEGEFPSNNSFWRKVQKASLVSDSDTADALQEFATKKIGAKGLTCRLDHILSCEYVPGVIAIDHLDEIKDNEYFVCARTCPIPYKTIIAKK